MASVGALGCALALLPTLSAWFLSEDFPYLAAAAAVRPNDLATVVRTGGAMGVWGPGGDAMFRPLPTLLLVGEVRLFGVDPTVHHSIDLVLHLAVGVLVARLAGDWGVPPPGRALAAAIFLLCPPHAVTVGWVSARSHVLVALFTLAALLLHRRSPRLALAPATLALATQELAVALPLAVLLHEAARPAAERSSWRALASRGLPLWMLIAGYLAARFVLFGGETPTIPDPLGTLSSTGSAFMADLPIALRALGAAWALAAAALVLNALVRRRPLGIPPGLLWPPLVGAPLLQPYQGFPWHAYLPSVGLAVWLGGVAATAVMRPGGWRVPGAVLVAALLAGEWALQARAAANLARLGGLSRSLTTATVAAAAETGAVGAVLLLPDDPRAAFEGLSVWEEAYPYPLRPPFADVPLEAVVPSIRTYCCSGWREAFGRRLDMVTRGEGGPIVAVEYDAAADRFVSRRLEPGDMRARLTRLESVR